MGGAHARTYPMLFISPFQVLTGLLWGDGTQDADAGNMTDMIDIFVPIINYIDNDPAVCPHYPSWAVNNTRPVYDPLEADGRELWWYQSCMSEGCAHIKPPAGGGCVGKDNACLNKTWPSYMIDHPATYNRVMSWISYV